MFDYGRTPAQWTRVTEDWSAAEATDGETVLRLISDLRIGHRGQPGARPPHAGRGRGAVRRARLAARPARPRALRQRQGAAAVHLPLLARLAGRRPLPGSSLAPASAALGADPEGPDLRADRMRRWRRPPPRCPRRPAASATGTTATAGCATPPSRCGGCTRSASTGRPTTSCSSWPTSSATTTARCRSCTGWAASATCTSRCSPTCTATRGARPVRIGNGAFRQQPERRVRRGARLGLPAHQDGRPHPAAPVAAAAGSGARRDRRLEAARPGDLGGARRTQALRVLEADVLGRARSRRAAGRARGRAGPGRGVAAPSPRRSATTSSPAAYPSAACSASTTRPMRSTPRPC